MTESEQVKLEQDGYLLLAKMLAPSQLDALRRRLEELWEQEGDEAGQENYVEVGARRLANLANKDEMFRALMCDPRVLDAVQAAIGPDIRLNMLNARDALPHSQGGQPLHADTDHGGKPDARGYYVCTAIWMIDDFTRANGATRLVPGSHRTGKVPKEVMPDPFAAHPDEIVVEGKAGDAFIFNGHVWHAGRENATDERRRAILVHYVRSDYPTRLNYPEVISPEVRAQLGPIEREVLGLG
jgi:Phytanoyl-CoA dioxygenase (PhyH)